jgi:hypothetical protein
VVRADDSELACLRPFQTIQAPILAGVQPPQNTLGRMEAQLPLAWAD